MAGLRTYSNTPSETPSGITENTQTLKTFNTMATQTFGKLDGAASAFQYNGRIGVASPVADYAVATVATLAGWKIIGSVVGLASSGSDSTSTEWKDDEGKVLTIKIEPGTLGYTFDIGSTSVEQLAYWLKAAKLTDSTNDFWGATAEFYKMKSTYTQTVPMVVINDTNTAGFLFPKAKMTATLGMVEDKFTIKVTIGVEDIDTANLSTAMPISKGGINLPE